MRTKLIIIILAVSLVALGSVLAIYMTRGGESTVVAESQGRTAEEPARTQTSAGPATQPQGGQQSDDSGNYGVVTTDQAGGAPGPVPVDISVLAPLDSWVTATHSMSDESIGIAFYVKGPASFTIQEKTADTWQTTGENVFYAGSGGLPARGLAAGEKSKTIRLLKIENGQYVAISSEFTVLRSEVIAAGGIKTYSQ